jgi:plastocyanin
MLRRALAVSAFALLAGCMGSGGPEAITSPDVREPARKDVVVQVENMSMMPAVARVTAGGNVAWTNMSDWLAVVVLPVADASAFQCQDLRPNFVRTAQGIESLPMRNADIRVTLPCALAKGRYPYQINLTESVRSLDVPMSVLKGEIVVE